MSTEMTKASLLDLMRTGRERWEKVLADVGQERMLKPGVEGDWSVTDIVAHVNTYELWVGEWLNRAIDGQSPEPSGYPDEMTMDERNAAIFLKNRELTLEQVLADSRRSYERLLEVVQALPEADLLSPDRFAWSDGDPIWQAIPGDSYDHYADHEATIRQWLVTQ